MELKKILKDVVKVQRISVRDHESLVEKHLTEKCLLTAAQAWNYVTIRAGTKLKNGEIITEEDARRFADKNDLNFESKITSYEISF